MTDEDDRRVGELIDDALPVSDFLDPHEPYTHDGSIEGDCAAFRCTDLGNAERFERRHKDNFIFVRGHGWLAWDGRRWDQDTGQTRAKLAAQRTVRAIGDEREVALQQKDRTQAAALKKWQLESESSRRINAMLNLVEPRLEKDIDEFDDKPGLLNVMTGTLELGETVRHRAGVFGIFSEDNPG